MYYDFCMHNTYICVNVRMYHTYAYDACMYSMIFLNKITLFNFFKWLSEGAGIPLDPPLVRMHRGNCNLRIADSKL